MSVVLPSVEFSGSERTAPEGSTVVGDVDPESLFTVTLHFRRRTPPEIPGSHNDLARFQTRMTHRALRAQRARTHARAAKRIANFMRECGIRVSDIDLLGRQMVLQGTVRRLHDIFGAEIRTYAQGDQRFIARTGVLTIPQHIAPWTRAVVGFDRRPFLRRAASVVETAGLWPTQVAQLYGIPLDIDVSQQSVAIIAMGGGYRAEDLAQALEQMGRDLPVVVDQSVDGVSNQFGADSRADQELALDLQVIASLLPRSRVVVYFAANTAESLANAIGKVTRDEINKPTVLSISWGSPEIYWTAPRREVVAASLADAARLRISVVAAAGDQLATCGRVDGKAHVWFPASSPYVLACGGTSIVLNGMSIESESTWNEGNIGTGGGISDYYPLPEFQLGAGVPNSVNDNHAGRGIPDVSALAAKSPGYRIVVDSTAVAMDGTSAATPLWAALIAMANAKRERSIGLTTPSLYRLPSSIRSITIGDNRQAGVGYSAGPGWNACTGLGVPRGGDLLNSLASV